MLPRDRLKLVVFRSEELRHICSSEQLFVFSATFMLVSAACN